MCREPRQMRMSASRWRRGIIVACAVLLIARAGPAETQSGAMRFVFTSSTTQSGQSTVVGPKDAYSDARGWGYENSGESAGASLFSVRLGEGNYAVTVVLGDPAGESDTIVKAEQRRLMLESVKTAKG